MRYTPTRAVTSLLSGITGVLKESRNGENVRQTRHHRARAFELIEAALRAAARSDTADLFRDQFSL
jgi:hypothetical protein